MINVPDRTPFQIRHAEPVAGPGIELTPSEKMELAKRQMDQEQGVLPHPKPQRHRAVSSRKDESAPAARRQRLGKKETVTAPSSVELPVPSEPSGHRQTLVDLETVMHMLDMVKASEREHLKSVLHIFNLLGPAGRVRVLHVLNNVFKGQ